MKKDDWRYGKRIFTCGGKAVVQRGANDFRVICASCFGGGTVPHETKDSANRVAVRDSGRECTVKFSGCNHKYNYA